MIQHDKRGVGVQNGPKQHDVIYEQPLCIKSFQKWKVPECTGFYRVNILNLDTNQRLFDAHLPCDKTYVILTGNSVVHCDSTETLQDTYTRNTSVHLLLVYTCYYCILATSLHLLLVYTWYLCPLAATATTFLVTVIYTDTYPCDSYIY